MNRAGHLEMDGCDLVSVASEYGTPIHVVSFSGLSANCGRIAAALCESVGDVEVFYSYKTNCVPGVLKVIHDHGIGAEVISPYELWVALKLGIPGEKIIYNGPHKTKESLEIAVKHGVRLVNVDSLPDLRNTLEVCRDHALVANVGMRLCPTVGWSAQFGFSMENGEAEEGLQIIDENRDCLELKGLHLHLGSQITDKSLFARALEEVFSFLRGVGESTRERLTYLDLGGGFGVPNVREISGVERRLSGIVKRPFRPPNPDHCPDIGEFGSVISQSLDRYEGVFPRGRPTVFVEPGRALTSNTQVLLLAVHALKRRKTPVAILDGGKMNITPPTFFEYHQVLPANKLAESSLRRYKLVGRTCTPSDVVYDNVTLPELEQGDIIAVMDAGAYFTSFSTDFAYPRPPVVMVHNSGITVLRRRETFDGMVERDVFS